MLSEVTMTATATVRVKQVSSTCAKLYNKVNGTFRPYNNIPVMLQLVRCR